jgi:hypothetical protein
LAASSQLKFTEGDMLPDFVKGLSRKPLWQRPGRRLMCLVLIFNFLIWSGSNLTAFASKLISEGFWEASQGWFLIKSLFGFQATPYRESLQDRLARVARIRVSPPKFVGYEGQIVSFSGLASDAAGRIVHGVKFNWACSDNTKVRIDGVGQAVFLKPGLSWITCSAGVVTAKVPVLVLPGQRRLQTDAEWRADQAKLNEDGTLAPTATTSSSSFVI